MMIQDEWQTHSVQVQYPWDGSGVDFVPPVAGELIDVPIHRTIGRF